MQLLIIVKPSVKKAVLEHLDWLKKTCEKKNILYITVKTTGNYEYDLASIKANAQKSQIAVAIGGDGTLNLALNGVINSTCSLAILPCGTGNDFARSFHCTAKQWQNAIFNAPTHLIDIGKINTRYFINVAGVGFDAHVIKQLGHLQSMPAWRYKWTSFKSLFTYRASTLQGVFLNKQSEYPNLITVFANSQYFGGGIKIAPRAEIDDGLLDCYQMQASSVVNHLFSFIKLLFKRHHTLKRLTYSQLKEAYITTKNLLVEADGELVGVTPAVIAIHKQAINFHIPIKKRLQ
ncbi:transcriptional regulator [Pseudoalteromonas sp. S3785]|uniref:diacylglycerol/lipid kinase family protein n=1 Tax=Pseudoalteromonas sp. S3785 TaxID=579545 RepID=UPI00110BC069|nr:diacylglycerol kinase family protein [Pseudoalteromonas sp. S3785]TMO70890.1 transcriptional regulator [Pseudoalteromonas sp. S3785]